MTTINWNFCQTNSDIILNTGVELLKESTKTTFDNKHSNKCGNYLISDKENKWKYIGEAKNISKRIKQHSKEKTSTFYKNYIKHNSNTQNIQNKLSINDFHIRSIQTNIGRKEIEEFGIVNIPANLNRFQKGKRNVYTGKININVWKEIQNNHEILLKQAKQKLLSLENNKWFDADIKSKAGIYWVEHPTKGLIYIGESSNIFDRYNTHSKTTYFSALRRHIGENILGFKLQTIKNKKRYFKDNEDSNITMFIQECSFKPFYVNFGRFELEEYLIKTYKPLLNRKDNK